MNPYFNPSSTSANDLFSNNGTPNTNNTTGSSSNGEQQAGNNDVNNVASFSYDLDYGRGGFASTFDRSAFPSLATNKDPLMNSYPNFTMMQAAAAASISSSASHHHHHQQQQQQQPIHLQQHPSAADYLLTPSNGTASWKQPEPISSSSLTATPGNDMISSAGMQATHPHHQLSSFSMAVTNPMLYYTHPWMRPGNGKRTGIVRKLINRTE